MGGTKKDCVLIAYGILEDGSVELLAIDIGNAESNRSWGKFVSGLKTRGLKDPLLVCSDGNPGVINAIDSNFPTSYRQRCLKHRMDNILDTVPVDEQNDIQERLHQIFYGSTSLEQAKGFIKNFKKEFGKRFPTTVERLTEDLDQCLTFFLFPALHWKRIRTSNKLERLNRELRRRLDVIGRHPDESGCLSLIYAVAKKYAAQQRGFSVDDLTKELWVRLRDTKVAMLEQLELDMAA
jgi:transposase-like protein